MLVEFTGGTLEQFGELVRRIAADSFDPEGSPHLLVAWGPGRPGALVIELPGEYFENPEAKDELGQLIAATGASGVELVGLVGEHWYAKAGSPAFEQAQQQTRSLRDLRDAGVDGVTEVVTAWIGDADAQTAWLATIERDASGARLGRWELWSAPGSRWHPWFLAGVEHAKRAHDDREVR